MKNHLLVLLALGTTFSFADQIVTGTKSDGSSTRSYVENGGVVIAKCAKYALNDDVNKKCKETSRKTYSSREDFMQQALYNFVTHGSKNKEINSLVKDIRKIQSDEDNQKLLKSKEEELKQVQALKNKIIEFGRRTGNNIDKSDDYLNSVSKEKVLVSDIESLSKQRRINDIGYDSLAELASLVARVYEDIANPKSIQVETKNSFNDELITLMQQKKKRNLSKMKMFKTADDYSIE